MIPCNGSSVIVHEYKHGDSIYRCTLDNAKKLLARCLRDEARDLNGFTELMKTETRPVRPASWLTKALDEVAKAGEQPERLRTTLYGGRPHEGDDLRPVAVITKEMQDELVLFCFRNNLKLEAFDGRTSLAIDALPALWAGLSFLEPARTRLGADVCLVEDYLYEGYDELKVLLKDSWKETAREENIVANYYCRFFNSWSAGRWSVESVADA